MESILNVAAVLVGTTSLGPGFRSILWVQGCPIRCAACIAPDWVPFSPAHLVSADALVDELLADSRVDGITFSGGEPMAQAAGLAQVARLARRKRGVNLLCFSGYTLERLRHSPPHPGVADLLAEIDCLIDGPYIAAQNHNVGLRGSSNQRIHHFTDRLAGWDLASAPRQAEIMVRDGQVMMVGVPPGGVVAAIKRVLG